MFDWFKGFFSTPDDALHPKLGRLTYQKGLGWKGHLPETGIEFLIGADRRVQPNNSATVVIEEASSNWRKIVGDCQAFLEREMTDVPSNLTPTSLQFLWPDDSPEYTRLEFAAEDDDRVFYVEMADFKPLDAGFDH